MHNVRPAFKVRPSGMRLGLVRLVNRLFGFSADRSKLPFVYLGRRVPRERWEVVGIEPRSEGGFGLDIALDVSLPGLARAEAEALVEKAHQVCPYSNATRNNVQVRTDIV